MGTKIDLEAMIVLIVIVCEYTRFHMSNGALNQEEQARASGSRDVGKKICISWTIGIPHCVNATATLLSIDLHDMMHLLPPWQQEKRGECAALGTQNDVVTVFMEGSSSKSYQYSNLIIPMKKN
jgi:hypothetical protein